MPSPTPGVHHVTAVASDPGRNLAFYTETLGLRLVKRSVNQDDVSVYHLFYGDRRGSPGTSMTFFPYVNARAGRVGTGQVTTTRFAIPADAADYWAGRLESEGVDVDAPRERLGETVIAFRDPDGLPLELVASDDTPAGDPPAGPVPERHAIRGFHGVEVTLPAADTTASLLGAMGFEATESAGDRTRYEAGGDLGAVLDVHEAPDAPRGTPGAGTVHHVAFRVTAAEQEAWRDLLVDHGLRPTEVIDRTWFESVYARTETGVLFEFATGEPGYTVDEDLEDLGETLVLPEHLEQRRDEIEAGLPDLDLATATE